MNITLETLADEAAKERVRAFLEKRANKVGTS
jgi:hypothetical protein